MNRFVLDSSLAMSWCIEDKRAVATQKILDGLAQGGTALAPSLWVWEINNALWQAERAGRLEAAKRHQQIALLQKLPIELEESAHHRAWSDVMNLASVHDLSIYDAAYLELALRHGLPLGSLDKPLRRAAANAGVRCLPDIY